MLSPNMDFQIAVAELTSQPRWMVIHDYFLNANIELEAGVDLDITGVDLKRGLLSASVKDSQGTLLATIEDYVSEGTRSQAGIHLIMFENGRAIASIQALSTDTVLAKLKAEFPQYDTFSDAPAPEQDRTYG